MDSSSVLLDEVAQISQAPSPTGVFNLDGHANKNGIELAERREQTTAPSQLAAATLSSSNRDGDTGPGLGLFEQPSTGNLATDLIQVQVTSTPVPVIHGCTACVKTFSTHSNLLRHVRKKHPGSDVLLHHRSAPNARDLRLLQPQLTDLSAHVECVASTDTTALPVCASASGSVSVSSLLGLQLAGVCTATITANVQSIGVPSHATVSSSSASSCGSVHALRRDVAAATPCHSWPCDKCEEVFSGSLQVYNHYMSCHAQEHSESTGSPVTTTTESSSDAADATDQESCAASGSGPQCSVCLKRFADTAKLATHVRKCHSDSKRFACDICQKTFTQKGTLTRHRNVHSPGKQYECSVCGKAFKDRHDCKRHERIHSGERPFQCSVCTKTFTQLVNLHKHQRIHSGEKPFDCGVCGKAFVERAKLQRHLRTHSGEQPYQCGICNRAFSQKHHQALHMRIHTGEKPHACDLCDKRFRDNKDLVRHRRLHTGEKPYSCSECNASFRLRALLTKHQRVTHTEPVMTSMVTDGLIVPITNLA